MQFSSRSLYASMAIAVAIMLVVESRISSLSVTEPLLDKLSDFESKQLDIFVEMNKLITTLATGLIAASVGFFVNRDQHADLTSADLRRASAIWISGALSLYFGHLTYRQIEWMLATHFFNIFYPGVWWPARLQFVSFLVSAVLLADFIFRTVTGRPHTVDSAHA
jgi:hypothetical protein